MIFANHLLVPSKTIDFVDSMNVLCSPDLNSNVSLDNDIQFVYQGVTSSIKSPGTFVGLSWTTIKMTKLSEHLRNKLVRVYSRHKSGSNFLLQLRIWRKSMYEGCFFLWNFMSQRQKTHQWHWQRLYKASRIEKQTICNAECFEVIKFDKPTLPSFSLLPSPYSILLILARYDCHIPMFFEI